MVTMSVPVASSTLSVKNSLHSGLRFFFFVVDVAFSPQHSNLTSGSDEPPLERRFRSMIFKPAARTRKIWSSFLGRFA